MSNVKIICAHCGAESFKSERYYKKRIREGATSFFCSRKCANAAHSQRMKGEGNPNFRGTYHGTPTGEWSEEKRRKMAKRISNTMREKGITAGKNNPRWRGGKKKFSCCICGKERSFRPYVAEQIESGGRQPTCSKECSLAYARQAIKSSMTDIEIIMEHALEEAGISFIPQYIVGNKFRLDFFIPEYEIAVECDGDYWHTLPEVAKRDKSKEAYLEACGMKVLRFKGSEIKDDINACIEKIMRVIKDREGRELNRAN